jgi:tetratricopeptide (TPR) repeat protein
MKVLIYTVLLAITCHFARGQSAKAETFFEKGEEAFRKGSYKTALAHFNECLRLNAYYMEAYYSRAMTREKLGDAKGALTDYNIYLESKPKDSEALFTRGLLRYQYGQWAMAREDFLAILSNPPTETNTVFYATGKENGNAVTTMRSQGMKPMMYNYLAMVDTKMKNYKRAKLYLDSAIQINKQEQEYFINRAYTFQMLGDTTRRRWN